LVISTLPSQQQRICFQAMRKDKQANGNSSRKCNYSVWRLLICFHLPKWDLLMQMHRKTTTEDKMHLQRRLKVMNERTDGKEIETCNFSSQWTSIIACLTSKLFDRSSDLHKILHDQEGTLMQLYDNWDLKIQLQITNYFSCIDKVIFSCTKKLFYQFSSPKPPKKLHLIARDLIGFLMT
jgi:hypothetical protein